MSREKFISVGRVILLVVSLYYLFVVSAAEFLLPFVYDQDKCADIVTSMTHLMPVDVLLSSPPRPASRMQHLKDLIALLTPILSGLVAYFWSRRFMEQIRLKAFFVSFTLGVLALLQFLFGPLEILSEWTLVQICFGVSTGVLFTFSRSRQRGQL